MTGVIGNAVLNILNIPYLDNQYLKAFIVLLIFYLLSITIAFILKRYVLTFTKKTKTHIDDIIVEKCHKPFTYFLFFVGVKIAVNILTLSTSLMTSVQHILNSIMIIIVTYALITIINVILDIWGYEFAKKTKSTIDDDVIPLLRKTSRFILIIMASIFILKEWDIDVTGLLAGVGIAGLAIGFAIKDSLANIFGGIQIILDKTYKVGDIIKLDDGDMGKVTDIGLRSTKIRTWDNELLIVPNGNLANSKIQNYELPDLSARIVIDFGVEYGSNIDNVKTTVLNVIKKTTHIMTTDNNKAPSVMFMSMGDSALLFKAFCWVPDISLKFTTKEHLTCNIYNALIKNKIGIPFPTRTIYMKKE